MHPVFLHVRNVRQLFKSVLPEVSVSQYSYISTLYFCPLNTSHKLSNPNGLKFRISILTSQHSIPPSNFQTPNARSSVSQYSHLSTQYLPQTFKPQMPGVPYLNTHISILNTTPGVARSVFLRKKYRISTLAHPKTAGYIYGTNSSP
jgi:hypothetical protein